MTKPDLPKCSVKGCTHAAGVIIGGSLLCGEHASEAIGKARQPPPTGNDNGKSS